MTQNQQIASNPEYSVWAEASAGTGKTKVLVDRLLRLLLNDVAPEKILCITFTKAAASEMQNRINDKLSRWVALDENELLEELKKLTGQSPNQKTLSKARTLFASVLEAPEGIRIQTIHSFCETILKKFPIEASVSPHFQVIDDATSNEMIDDIIIHLIDKKDETLQEAIKTLSLKFNADSFKDTLKDIISSRDKFKKYNILELKTKIKNKLGVSPSLTREKVINQFFNEANIEQINYYCDILREGTASETAKSAELRTALDNKDFGKYKLIFLTESGEPRKKILNKKLAEAYPSVLEYALSEQQRVLECDEQVKTIDIFHITNSLLTVAQYFIDLYEKEKSSKGYLDYDDLIFKTANLLKTSASSQWVLYKLDGGLDHILLDEAQDTSQQQWEIITSLVQDWFSGQTSREENRTIFVVGDKKQSIYSFQGADPDIFSQKKEELEQAVKQSDRIWKTVPLNISFRSTEAVLELVDKVFNADLTGVSDEPIKHTPNRKGEAGKIEIWEKID